MFSQLRWVPLLVALAVLSTASWALAQPQVTVQTPYHALNESFFENMGVSWGLNGRNWNLRVFGSPLQAAPQFGGFDPSAGLNSGVYFQRNGMNGFFNWNFSQGVRRSFTTQVPVLTLQNGMPGAVWDTSVSPFVISHIPVVGGYPMATYLGPPGVVPSPGPAAVLPRPAVPYRPPYALPRRPAARPAPAGPAPVEQRAPLAAAPDASNTSAPGGQSNRSASSAERPAPSVEEARRLYEAEQAQQNQEAVAFIERARHAEQMGKPNVARIYYQMAYRRASGQLKAQVLERLQALGGSPGSDRSAP